MYKIEAIATILQDANLAILGQTMFLYHSPADVENCIILYPSNDPPLIDPDTPGYYKGKFQTIVRANTYALGFSLCQQASSILTKNNLDCPLIYIKMMRPLMQARAYRRSESGILEFSVTYDIRYIEK